LRRNRPNPPKMILWNISPPFHVLYNENARSVRIKETRGPARRRRQDPRGMPESGLDGGRDGGAMLILKTADGKNTVRADVSHIHGRRGMETNDMTDDIEEMLDEALDNNFRSVFEPDTKELVKAMFELLLMRLKLKTSKLMTADENRNLDKAFAVVGGYLDYAYPGFNKALIE